MSRADDIFAANMQDILENGVWDTDLQVRPHWEDGAPAHTVKKFGIVNRYDLREELPILTIRRTAFRSCIDEILWIWQKKSNNIKDLHSHIWDSWADESGSPSARRTATSWRRRRFIRRGNSTRWTGCCSTSKTIPPAAGL